MRVRIDEARQDCSAPQIGHLRVQSLVGEDGGVRTHCDDLAALDRQFEIGSAVFMVSTLALV